jgi:RNA polymerase sigma factor (sigma-70 family)
MTLNGSQTLDALYVERLITELSPNVSKALYHACRFYGHPANQDEINDLTQDILVKLIEDGHRRLLSYDGRSNINTWLYTVVRRALKPCLLRQRWEKECIGNMDDLSPDALSYQPTQEERLIDEDERRTLRAIISRLTRHKRRLAQLMLLELKPEEIAKEMGIRIESFYAKESALLKEMRELIEREQSL